MNNIVVFGANGQLGEELKHSSIKELGDVQFWSRAEFDITDESDFNKLKELNPKWVINAAAYTNVDQAEDHPESAFAVNADAVQKLAKIVHEIDATLIHISSDYVYDNGLQRPLLETDPCRPKGVYAKSKHLGDVHVQAILDKYYIIRTSWVYSSFGHNFVKTMLRLSQKLNEIKVVDDQIGSPTLAKDIADLITIIVMKKPDYGLYNFCNSDCCSWNEFARAIFEIQNLNMTVRPISTENYGAKAPRPKYSVLNCEKIQKALGADLKRRSWKLALEETLRNL